MAAFQRWLVPAGWGRRVRELRRRWRLRWQRSLSCGRRRTVSWVVGAVRGTVGGPAGGWEPTLFSTPRAERFPVVDRRSSPAEKIELFRALFSGRDDVFRRCDGKQTENQGKSGWSPAVVGGWVNSKRPDHAYEPLTDAVVDRRLAGEIAAGLYPLLRDDRCRSLACDFDGGSWALDALAYLDACRAAGLPAVLERSRFFSRAMVVTCGCSSPVLSQRRMLARSRRCCVGRWRLGPRSIWSSRLMDAARDVRSARRQPARARRPAQPCLPRWRSRPRSR